MFTNLATHVRLDPITERSVKTVQLIERDPCESQTPLNQPNYFQFNNKLRTGFREYLNGDKSAVELVNEINHTRLQQTYKLKNKVKKLQRANLFAGTLRRATHVKIAPYIQQAASSEKLDLKVRAQLKFDKIRKIIEAKKLENNQDKDSVKLTSVQLFKNLFETCEANNKRIQQKNLLSERSDGIREYESARYIQKGHLRVREAAEQTSRSINQVRLEHRVEKLFNKLDVRNEIDDKLSQLWVEQYTLEQKQLLKAKKQLQLDCKRKQPQYKNFLSLHFKEPLSKDVELYAYLHTKKQPPKLREKPKLTPPPNVQQEISQKHYISNFKGMNTSRESISDNSSLNSMMEIHIDNLYHTSNNLQTTLMHNNSEKFVKRIRQFQKVQSLNDRIVKLNQYKLSSQRKIVIS